ncbi:MAG TPA: glycosyltransferase [Methylomirabilota bacterium]|jgi:processive 1,2-diacylglycerol beta-glucosyltransferase|nr:glycosyltransferase [Methylomirabilota bacterium]
MPRVLITTAPYGSGHDRVAAALAQAFTAAGVKAETVDHFERFVSPLFARMSRTLFWAVLRGAPGLWGWAYALSARLPTRSPAMAGMNRLGARALGRYLAAVRPDVVVHVHPTAAGALAWLRARGLTAVPQAVVLTDFAAHPQWIYPDVDRYFAPCDAIGGDLVARGVPAERVVASGIPIDRAFLAPADQVALRAALGLAPDVPTPLVMGGMQGRVGGIAETCEVLGELTLAFQALVVCGGHRGLAERLRGRFASDARFRIFGQVADVHRLMGAADFVVTKAGASTCAEALALERPLLFYRSLPGQERANERAITQAGAGVRAGDRAALRQHLGVLLADPRRRAGLAAAAERLRRPEAADTVAKELLALSRAGA